jgi:hypothetical protein
MAVNGITADAGLLIGFDRRNRAAVALVARARERKGLIAVPAGVVGQVWRDGRRQANLARLLGSDACEIVPLDGHEARAAGQLCGATGSSDVIDSSVVLCAQARGHGVATSDPDDIHRLDPTLRLIIV